MTALDALHSDIELQTLSARIVETVRLAVPHDMICLDVFDNSNRIQSQMLQYPYVFTPELHNLTAQYVEQHPLFVEGVLKRNAAPKRIKDFAARTDYYDSIFYNEIYRPLSIDDQIGVGMNVTEDVYISCCFNRSKKDFSEEECQITSLIESHLTLAIRNTWALEKARSGAERLQSAVENISTGMIVLDADGGVEFINEAALSLLQKYFSGAVGVAAVGKFKLPEVVEAWRKIHANANFNGSEFRLPPAPLVVANQHGRLRITLSFNGGLRQQTLLFEEQLALAPENLTLLDLTRREAEILYRVAHGKTDAEIAALHGISLRTVQNHLQHIYIKLGVENRTAAVLRAMELAH